LPDRVEERLKLEEKRHLNPVYLCTKKYTAEEKNEIAMFKNDLMQLVVDCQMSKFRGKVNNHLYLTRNISGLETFLGVSGDKIPYELL